MPAASEVHIETNDRQNRTHRIATSDHTRNAYGDTHGIAPVVFDGGSENVRFASSRPLFNRGTRQHRLPRRGQCHLVAGVSEPYLSADGIERAHDRDGTLKAAVSRWPVFPFRSGVRLPPPGIATARRKRLQLTLLPRRRIARLTPRIQLPVPVCITPRDLSEPADRCPDRTRRPRPADAIPPRAPAPPGSNGSASDDRLRYLP